MKPKMRLAVVGCGDIGSAMAFFAAIHPKIRLTACCDPDEERVEKLARRFRVPGRYRDFDEMLAQEELDGVYLAVPHHLHLEMIRAGAKTGIAVFVEKPIARTLEEGIAAVRVAEQRKVRLGVNYQYRYDTGCYRLARNVQAGVLGHLLHARINVPWSRSMAYFERSAWHRSIAAAGGGTLITQASHFIDIALWAWGSRPVSVLGRIAQRKFDDVEVEDTVMGIIEMEDGGMIEVTSSMGVIPEQAVRIEIYGEKGTGIYSDRPLPHARFSGVPSSGYKPPHFGLHALQRSLEGFRAWIMDDRPYLVPGRDALPALAVVDALYKSARSGRLEPVCSEY